MGAQGPIVGRTLGHYHILEQIGAGGMGVVFRARDERLDRDVAIKLLPPGLLVDEHARKRFHKESLTLSKLNHPNIATIYDFDSEQGVDFLVMEFISGTNLDEKLAASPLAEKEILRLGLQMAEGLTAAHAKGVVHRDLKPGNLRITPDGRLKILDFGLAKLALPNSTAAETDSSSQSAAPAGTLPYMAPEQLLSSGIDVRTDIHAFGAVLYEMATGRRPFTETQNSRLADAILHQAPVSPRAVNARVLPDLEHVILKCLEKDPENRYQSVNDLGVDLRRMQLAATAQSTPAASANTTKPRIPWLTAAVMTVGILVLAGFILNYLRERSRGPAASGRIQSLAVLPLENLSGDKEQEYFADGMTEILIADLAQISALRVTSRQSSMRYKGTTKPLPEIARELHVDAIVTGSVERAAERVRITAELIYAPTDRHVWAKTYERDLRDVLALQSSVADGIASEIRIKLTPQEQERLASARPVNPDAQEAYLKGRYYWHENADAKKSLGYLLQATEKDPGYAQAYAALADIYGLLANFGDLPLEDAHARWEAAATKAMELDDTLAEAHKSLAALKFYRDWDWQGSEREFKRAIELSPSQAEAHQWYSDNLLATGRVAAAVAEIKKAQELDPFSRSVNEMVPERLYYAREYDQAIEQARKTIELYPRSHGARVILGLAYEQQGKLEEAIAEFQKVIGSKETIVGTTDATADVNSIAALGHADALAGRKQEAQKQIAKLIQLPEQHYRLFSMGVIYAGLGERDKAFAWLGEAANDRHYEPPEIKVDPRLDSLRADPRFHQLLLRMGLPP